MYAKIILSVKAESTTGYYGKTVCKILIIKSAITGGKISTCTFISKLLHWFPETYEKFF